MGSLHLPIFKSIFGVFLPRYHPTEGYAGRKEKAGLTVHGPKSIFAEPYSFLPGKKLQVCKFSSRQLVTKSVGKSRPCQWGMAKKANKT